MYVIATRPFRTAEEAEDERRECYDDSYHIYQIGEKYYNIDYNKAISFFFGCLFLGCVIGYLVWRFL